MLPIHVLAALGLASSVAANYHIDNAHHTVSYAGSGADWQTFSFTTQNLTLVLSDGNFTVDSSKCYNRSYTLAACTVQNNCRITFPFTGSGVSVFVMHAGFQGISASLTIDGDQSVTATMPAPDPPSYQTPNVSLFDLQSLPSAVHTATINLLDWDNGTTSLYFDYALINQSLVELPASLSTGYLPSTLLPITGGVISSTTSPTTHPANASSTITSTFVGSTLTSSPITGSSVNLGALVGGACGGLVVLISVITAIILLKKCKSHRAKLKQSRRPDPFPIISTLARDQIDPSPANPQTARKGQLPLASRNAMVYHSPGLSDGEVSEFHTHSTPVSAGRRPDVVATLDDLVIDCRPENRSSTDLRTVGSESSPPCYQSLDPRDSDASRSLP